MDMAAVSYACRATPNPQPLRKDAKTRLQHRVRRTRLSVRSLPFSAGIRIVEPAIHSLGEEAEGTRPKSTREGIYSLAPKGCRTESIPIRGARTMKIMSNPVRRAVLVVCAILAVAAYSRAQGQPDF